MWPLWANVIVGGAVGLVVGLIILGLIKPR